jgi:hypothetical protein
LWKVPNLFDKMHNFIMKIMIIMLFMLIVLSLCKKKYFMNIILIVFALCWLCIISFMCILWQ